MSKFSYFSRILCAFIALLFFASSVLARDCQPKSQILEFKTSTSPMLRVSTRASVANDIRVLPESFTMIETAAVADKSPSIGAKSVGFWGHVGEWFENTAVSIQKDPIQVAWFALGFVPVVGGAIDCGKAMIQLILNQEVDLFAAEMGCIGMTIDAITILAVRPETEVTTRGVLGTLRAMNEISRSLRGAISKVGLSLFERFMEHALSASELVDELFKSSYVAKLWLEGGEAAARKFEQLSESMLVNCAIPLPRVRDVESRGSTPLCGTQAYKFLRLMNVSMDALSKGFGHTADEAVTKALEWQAKYMVKKVDPIEAIQEIEKLGKAADRALIASGTKTEWISPAKLRFQTMGNSEGTRVIHVIQHTADGIYNADKSIFADELGKTLSDEDTLEFLDKTWEKVKSGEIIPKNPPSPRSNNICIDFGKVIGVDNNGNPVQQMVLALDRATFDNTVTKIPDVGDIITAFPLDYAYDLAQKALGKTSYCH